jgi:hypothetical protein
MNLFFLHPRNKDPKDELDKHALIIVHEPPHDTTEGSEFLDDAIRTEDQPLMYTEISISVGCPEGLL